jgi:glyoxylase-like metal-dependent hydrolase (beta-lactamase superfamily II)
MTVRIGHGGASPEGENSTYLLPDRGVVIDPGPPGEAAWERLQSGIGDAGASLTDVDHVVVTHWHIDHAGLAPRLAEAADATIHMHESDAPLVADYAVERQARLQRDTRRLRSWDAPEDVIDAVRESDTPSPIPDECPVVPHTDGDTVAGLELLHTPGHTQGHVAVLGDEVARTTASGPWGHGGTVPTLFAGDLVLPTYTPNVGGSDTRLADPLTAFLRSLARIEEWSSPLPRFVVRPGHGPEVALNSRLGVIRRHHRTRLREVAAVFENHERVTPWTVATELFGEMDGIHAKMGVGEAAAHLTFMESRGVVEQFGSSPDQYLRCWDTDLSAALNLTVDA